MERIINFEEYFKQDKNIDKCNIFVRNHKLYDTEGNCYYRFLQEKPFIEMYENCYSDIIKMNIDISLKGYKQYLYMETVVYKQRELAKQKLLNLFKKNIKTIEFDIFECDYAQIKNWDTDEALQAINMDRRNVCKYNCLTFVPHSIIRLILESGNVEKRTGYIRINLNTKRLTEEQCHKIYYIEEDF